MSTVNIGLLGCGNVGQALVGLVESERSRIRLKHGLDLRIRRILVRDLAKRRRGVAATLLTNDVTTVIDDDDCDVVVELIGGVHSAGAYVRRAIARGRHVVTANKALLAACGRDLFEAAERNGVSVGYEASVCGAVPVVATLERCLAGDTIESIRGIVNGTCNFVLSRMEEGLTFAEALRLAQDRGFAEADPELDVSGEDASQKIRILSALAFDAPIISERVIGIRAVTRQHLERARAGGCVIRLVASATRTHRGIDVAVEPKELDANDVLANVRDENNTVVIRARAAGELTLSGRGAGGPATATAVLADVLEVARTAGVWRQREESVRSLVEYAT